MSDIKMSDLLALPVVRTAGGVMPFLKDGNGEVMFVGDDYHIDAVVQAVNAHDTMQARIAELEKAISGILNSPHTKLTKGALLEVSEIDIDTAIKALNK